MKQTTCNNLRGACEEIITGNTPEEMGAKSRDHVMKLVRAGDKPHQEAIESMKQLSLEGQQAWYADFIKKFPTLPEA